MKPASQQVSVDCSWSQRFCSVNTPHPQGETVAARPTDISQVGRPGTRKASISFYHSISVPAETSRPSVTALQLASIPFNQAPGTKQNIPGVRTHAEQWIPYMQTLSKRVQQRTAELCPFPVVYSANCPTPKLTAQDQPRGAFFLESVSQATGTVPFTLCCSMVCRARRPAPCVCYQGLGEKQGEVFPHFAAHLGC